MGCCSSLACYTSQSNKNVTCHCHQEVLHLLHPSLSPPLYLHLVVAQAVVDLPADLPGQGQLDPPTVGGPQHHLALLHGLNVVHDLRHHEALLLHHVLAGDPGHVYFTGRILDMLWTRNFTCPRGQKVEGSSATTKHCAEPCW